MVAYVVLVPPVAEELVVVAVAQVQLCTRIMGLQTQAVAQVVEDI